MLETNIWKKTYNTFCFYAYIGITWKVETWQNLNLLKHTEKIYIKELHR